MPNAITILADRQRNEIGKADAENLRQLIAAYGVMYGRLQGDIDALILAIEKLEEPTAAAVKALPQYRRLVRNSENELDRFTVVLETMVAAAGVTAITLGLSHSSALVNTMVGGGFSSLEPAVMQQLLRYLDPAGPLYARLQTLTVSTVDAVVQSIIDGVSSGQNPRKIATAIQSSFGRGLTDALRNTRTVQIYAYRDSARANYMATDFVQGWVWYAELDDRVCLSCVAQHGTIHALDEKLNDHYNGRCAALPYIPEFGSLVDTPGADWFSSLDEAQQKSMMGASKWEAWNAGKFEFSKLSHEHDNDVYGPMKSEASLKTLIGE